MANPDAVAKVDSSVQLLNAFEKSSDELTTLSETASAVFKKNHAAQKAVIDSQAERIALLEAELIKERGKNAELTRTHDAALKVLKEKESEKAKLQEAANIKIREAADKVAFWLKHLGACIALAHERMQWQIDSKYGIPSDAPQRIAALEAKLPSETLKMAVQPLATIYDWTNIQLEIIKTQAKTN